MRTLKFQDSWWDVLNKTDFVANHQNDFAQYARPGYWNDPDMVKQQKKNL